MPPKKATSVKKTGATPAHASYKAMITDAILNLKDRLGSSRQAIKKYVLSNNSVTATGNSFDNLFNRALRTGVEAGDFAQPKGPSGPVKLVKKSPTGPAKPAVKKPAPKKPTVAKPKPEDTKKPAVVKKKTGPKPKTAVPAPASSPEKPKALAKTKTGRVAKPKVAKPAVKKAPATKKAPAKKASPKKKATPTAA
ncbi:MAG: hypothetical protein M1814_006862 [Vezdaea aestivalis]|nr:MAG: hypothetical protein M1814_006862 [Vezdaea aestivalis]